MGTAPALGSGMQRTGMHRLVVLLTFFATACAADGARVGPDASQDGAAMEPGGPAEDEVLVGVNGAGFFETMGEPGGTAWTEGAAALEALDGPLLLRLPGGAISRFANPVRSARGWGLVREDVEAYYETHPPDGEELEDDGLEKWLREADGQPERSYVDALVALSREREVRVVWVLNLFTSTPDEAVGALDLLIDRGVDVVGVEAGNEVYSKFEEVAQMLAVAQPLFDEIHRRHPTLRRSFVGAPLWPRADHERWNAELAAHLASHPDAAEAVTLHPYLASSRMPECQSEYDAWLATAPVTLTYDRATPHLDEAFACARAATHGFGTQTIPSWIAQSRERFAGHEIWLTEWNVKPVLPFVNTWMHGAFAFETWLALFETEGLTLAATHNGISPDIFGLLSNARDLDATTRTLVPRVALHAMVLAAEARRGERLGGESVGLVRATTLEGEHGRVFFVNDGATAVMLAVPDGQRPLGLRVVSGRALYASAGHAGPLVDASGYRRSPPGVEIEGIEARPFDGTVPPFSFGILDTTSAP